MIKNSLSIAIIFIGTTAFASAVKVTNFRFLSSGSSFSSAAELCGELVVDRLGVFVPLLKL